MAGKQEDVDDDNMPLGSLATLHKDSRKPANKQPGSQAADQGRSQPKAAVTQQPSGSGEELVEAAASGAPGSSGAKPELDASQQAGPQADQTAQPDDVACAIKDQAAVSNTHAAAVEGQQAAPQAAVLTPLAFAVASGATTDAQQASGPVNDAAGAGDTADAPQQVHAGTAAASAPVDIPVSMAPSNLPLPAAAQGFQPPGLAAEATDGVATAPTAADEATEGAAAEPTQATDAGGSGSTVGRPRRATRSASLKSPADGPTSEPRVTRAKAGRGRGGKSDLLRSASEAGDSDADPNTPRGGVSGPAAAALARKNSRNRGAAKGQAQAQGQERDPDAQDEVKREASAPEGQAGPVEESQETPAAQGSKRRPRRGSDAGKAGSKAEAEALPEGSSRDASAEPAVPAGRTAAHPATTPIDRLRAHSAALQGEAGATAGSQENALSADAGDGDGAAAAEDPLPDAEPDTQGKKGTKRQLSRRHSSRAVHKPATYSPSRETKPKSEPRPRRGKPAVADEAAAGEPEAEAEVKDGQMPDAGKAEPPAADAAEDLHVNEAQEKEASGPDAGTHPGDPRDAYEPEAGDEHESPVRLKPGQSITRKRANKRKKDDEPVGYDEAQELSASAKKHKAKKRSKEPAPEQPAFEPDEDYLDDPENLRQAKKKRDAIHRLEASYREAQEAATKLADQVDALLEQCGDVEVTLDILKDTGLGRDIARVAKQRQQVSEHLAERGAKARSLVDKWRSLTLGGGKPSKAKSASAEPKAASAAQPSTTEPPSGPAADDARPTAGAAGTAVEDQAAVRPASKAAAAATARLTSGDLHSLGDDTRDKGVSILTYALTPPLALTPEEAAKQLEAALFDKYAENGAADVLYRRRLHALWSYLSPESCHVIAELRSELLEGKVRCRDLVVTPNDSMHKLVAASVSQTGQANGVLSSGKKGSGSLAPLSGASAPANVTKIGAPAGQSAGQQASWGYAGRSDAAPAAAATHAASTTAVVPPRQEAHHQQQLASQTGHGDLGSSALASTSGARPTPLSGQPPTALSQLAAQAPGGYAAQRQLGSTAGAAGTAGTAGPQPTGAPALQQPALSRAQEPAEQEQGAVPAVPAAHGPSAAADPAGYRAVQSAAVAAAVAAAAQLQPPRRPQNQQPPGHVPRPPPHQHPSALAAPLQPGQRQANAHQPGLQPPQPPRPPVNQQPPPMLQQQSRQGPAAPSSAADLHAKTPPPWARLAPGSSDVPLPPPSAPTALQGHAGANAATGQPHHTVADAYADDVDMAVD